MAITQCSTPGCDRDAIYRTKQLCKRCYKRKPPEQLRRTSPFESDVVRFEKRIVMDDECWRWVGNFSGDYGVINLQGRQQQYAHRWSYSYHRAPIPAGLEIDHLCHNTYCVNPYHLEPATRQVNAARTRGALKTHCKRGHEYTPANTIRLKGGNGQRWCRECARMHGRRADAKRRAAGKR